MGLVTGEMEVVTLLSCGLVVVLDLGHLEPPKLHPDFSVFRTPNVQQISENQIFANTYKTF